MQQRARLAVGRRAALASTPAHSAAHLRLYSLYSLVPASLPAGLRRCCGGWPTDDAPCCSFWGGQSLNTPPCSRSQSALQKTTAVTRRCSSEPSSGKASRCLPGGAGGGEGR
jgi:hypothetical protein